MRATTSVSTPLHPQDGPSYLTTRRTSARTASAGDSGLGKGRDPSPIRAGQHVSYLFADMLYCCCWFLAARRRGEARVSPRTTHPATTMTRPHQKFTLKPRSPSLGAAGEISPTRTIVTP